jgi:hypothetical protein
MECSIAPAEQTCVTDLSPPESGTLVVNPNVVSNRYFYSRIQDAVSVAEIMGVSLTNPKLIMVAEGTYTENITVSSPGITIRGFGGPSPNTTPGDPEAPVLIVGDFILNAAVNLQDIAVSGHLASTLLFNGGVVHLFNCLIQAPAGDIGTVLNFVLGSGIQLFARNSTVYGDNTTSSTVLSVASNNLAIFNYCSVSRGVAVIDSSVAGGLSSSRSSISLAMTLPGTNSVGGAGIVALKDCDMSGRFGMPIFTFTNAATTNQVRLISCTINQSGAAWAVNAGGTQTIVYSQVASTANSASALIPWTGMPNGFTFNPNLELNGLVQGVGPGAPAGVSVGDMWLDIGTFGTPTNGTIRVRLA